MNSRELSYLKVDCPHMRGACVGVLLFALQPALGQEAGGSDRIEEITVTAAKREQSSFDVATPISVLTGEDLQEMGAQSLSDYITTLPGVHFNDYQPGVSEVVIRGISSTTYHEQGQTVVGYYINEIPLSEAGWPVVIPDVDTFDLERVEVLRGPQGSLFGSSTLGGLVNYIAKEANPSAFESAVETMIGWTDNAGEANYAAKGMLNLPVAEDKLGIRLVGLQRFDAGFIDNIRPEVEDGAADLTTTGGRLSAVYTPSEGTKISWLTMYQEMALEDQTYLIVEDVVRDKFIKEPHDTDFLINSLRLDQDLGFADLTLLGALADKNGRLIFDRQITGYLQGQVPTEAVSNVTSEAVHAEARLSSKGDGRLEWLVGAAYYESDKSTFDVVYQDGAADFIDANPGVFDGNPGSLLAPNDFISRYVADQSNDDLGLFGEMTFNLTDSVSITAGGRWFDTSSETTVARPPSALFVGTYEPTGTSFTEVQSETGFTPKVSVAYRPNDQVTTYALYSKGYRVGGANPNPPGLTGVPTSYDSDTVDNYELGVRTRFADGAVLLDAAVFRIDWDDIQVRLFTPAPFFYSYVTNAGEARIEGVEFSGAWRASEWLDLNATVTYQDAALTDFLPATFAPGGGYAAGTQLPGSSEWSTSETATLFLDMLPWSPRVALSHRYVSDAPVAFGATRTRGEFNIWDLRAGASFSESITASLFVENLFDTFGILNAPFTDALGRPAGTIVRPRSVGLRLNWEF